MIMAECIYLAGKVTRLSLPVFEDARAGEALTLKRLLLPQGELAQFYDDDEPIRYLAFLELRAGGVRANHYHKIKRELIYLIAGELLLIVEDIGSRERVSLTLRPGDLAAIQPGIAHALQTTVPGQAIEFSRTRFERADIHRFPLV